MRNLCLLFLVGLATGLVSDRLLVASQSSSLSADDLYLEGHSSADLPIDDEDGGDDEDFNSGSGSGDYGFIDTEETLRKILNISTTTAEKEVLPTRLPQFQSTRKPAEEAATVTPSMSPGRAQDEKVPAVEATTATTQNRPVTPSMSTQERTTASIDISIDLEDNSLDRWDNPKDKENKEVEKPVEDNEIVPNGGKRMVGNYNEVTSESMWERTEVLAAVIACVVVGCVCAIFLLFILAYRMKKKDEGSYDLGDTKISATAYQKAPTKEFYA